MHDMNNFTRLVYEGFYQSPRYFSFLQEMKTDPSGLPEDHNPDLSHFNEEIITVRNNYIISGRRFLLQWAKERYGIIDDGNYVLTFWDYTGKKHQFSFPQNHDITYVQNMSNDEIRKLRDLLLAVVLTNENRNITALPKREQVEFAAYIRNISEESQLTNSLKRKEEPIKDFRASMLSIINTALECDSSAKRMASIRQIMLLAHGLQLDIHEMMELCFRSLDDESISCTRSQDLIDLYCCSSKEKNSIVHAHHLKQIYHMQTVAIQKSSIEEKPYNFTRSVQEISENMLFSRFHNDHEFLQWVVANASYWDVPSKSAIMTTKKLVFLAYSLLPGEAADRLVYQGARQVPLLELVDSFFEQPLPEGLKWVDILKKLNAYLFDRYNFRPDDNDTRKIFSSEEAKRGFFQYPNVVSSTYSRRKIGSTGPLKERLEDILAGKRMPMKADILFLSFLISSFVWETRMYDGHKPFDEIDSFISVCDSCLRRCFLPSFYAPHIMEYTLLSSIVESSLFSYIDDSSPLQFYVWFCESQRTKISRKQKKT